MKNKEILIILASVAVLFSVFGYFSRGALTPVVSGYMILMDHQTPMMDGTGFEYTTKNYESTIYLPSSDCNCEVTVCSYEFPEWVDPKADVTKDGRIDFLEIQLLQLSYGKTSLSEDWDTPFSIDKCLFVIGDKRFEDPDRDCDIDSDDLNYIKGYYGAGNTNPFAVDCTGACAADLNKDGKVDILDVSMAARKYNQTADLFKSFSYLKPKDLDLNNDGNVDLKDVVVVAKNYGAIAIKQKCEVVPAEHVSGEKWKVQAKNKYGIYHVGASYRCLLK